MKFKIAFLVGLLHLTTGSLIQEDFGDSFDYLSRQRKDVQGIMERHSSCKVSEFEAVQDLDLVKLDGDWYEVFRTVSSVQFRSGLWRIESTKGVEAGQEFIFKARFVNNKCMEPVHGEIIPSPNNPSSFVLKYRGLKGDIEEEFKVIHTDYRHRLVLYGCRKIQEDGQCQPDASVLIILSNHKNLGLNVQQNMKLLANKVCIDPSSLIQQDGKNACSMDSSEPHLPSFGIQDPVCKKTSLCTLACPPCCVEDSDGCIECHCNGDTDRSPHAELAASERKEKDQTGCVIGLKDCPNDKCHLREKSPGCQVCDCPVLLRAPPEHTPPHAIDDVRKCPTTCRIIKDGNQMLCDCNNKYLCQPIPEGVPHSCKEEEERWYFDDRTGTCHGFYGSCLEGTNNFKSLKECINTCADVCELPLDSGSCGVEFKEPVTRYYFNRNRGECDQFNYFGCGGNPNNFETLHICQHKCPAWMDNQESGHRPKKCYEPSEKGNCKESHIRYFFLPVTRTCTSFFFSGCGENENNFKSLEECERACTVSHAEPKQCPDLKSCPCAPKLVEDDCSTCPCSENDDDDGTSISGSVSILLLSSLLWLAARWRL